MAQTTVSRQETYDTMEGIKAYDNDGNSVLDRGFDTDQSPCLGARNILSFDAKRGKSLVKFYHTYAQAMQDLECILRHIESGVDPAANEDPVVQKLREVLQAKLMQYFLERKCLVPLLEKNHKGELHYQLANWLCRLAQSAGLGTRSLANLATAALTTLLSLRRHGKLSKTVFIAASLEHFCLSLECWVNLALSRKPHATKLLPEKGPRSRHNLAGLENLLKFWDITIANECTLTCRDATITKCITALSRLELDHAVSSSQTGFNLRPKLQRLIAKLLGMVAARDDHIEWMDKTAEAVLYGLSDLGPGPPGSEDMDDSEASLCYSLIVRLFPIVDSNYETRRPPNQFKAILSMHALQILLGVEDIADIVQTVLNETGNLAILKRTRSSLGWLTIACAYAAMIEVNMADNIIAEDGPRCLATVECAFSAFQAGMLLLNDASGRDSTTEYGNKEQAGVFAHMLGLLGLQCQQLSKLMAPKTKHPHFRRVYYTLICCRHLYRAMKVRASQLAGSDEKILAQRGIDYSFS
jgi:hypothetical protein